MGLGPGGPLAGPVRLRPSAFARLSVRLRPACSSGRRLITGKPGKVTAGVEGRARLVRLAPYRPRTDGSERGTPAFHAPYIRRIYAYIGLRLVRLACRLATAGPRAGGVRAFARRS